MRRVRCCRDFGGFVPGAVVAPEVVIVDGLELRIDGDDGGACGVERDGLDRVPVDSGSFNGTLGGGGERGHVVGMALGCVVGIFLFAEERVLGDSSAQAALLAVENGDADAESSEIDSGYDAH